MPGPRQKRRCSPPLLDYLRDCGVENSQITVLIAAGTHPTPSQAEIEETFGTELCRQIRIVGHDCHAPDLVSVGTLKHLGEILRSILSLQGRICASPSAPFFLIRWRDLEAAQRLSFPA